MKNQLPLPSISPNEKWTKALNAIDFRSFQFEVMTFKPDLSLGLEGQAVEHLYHKLFPSSSNVIRHPRYNALQALLLALAQCTSVPHLSNHRCGFIQSLSTHQPKYIPRYKCWDFSQHILVDVLKTLIKHKFVVSNPGFRGKNHNTGVASLFAPTEVFFEWFRANQDYLRTIRFKSTIETLVMKSGQGNRKKLMDYEDNLYTRAMRERVDSSNNHRREHEWTYVPTSVDDKSAQRLNTRIRLNPESLICRRIFNGNFQSGGRFYCAAQNLKRSERETLKIDNEDTIELDYKCLHPRIMYNEEGLDAPVDCYASSERDREITKKVFLYCINCESRTQAINKLRDEFSLNRNEAATLIKALLSEHPLIAHKFFQAQWRHVQFLDGLLVDRVLSACLSENIPVLPVHDSFIVKSKDATKLYSIMNTAYERQFGFKPVITGLNSELKELAA